MFQQIWMCSWKQSAEGLKFSSKSELDFRTAIDGCCPRLNHQCARHDQNVYYSS
uniref:Uncharacterized protein n=1 Tax=Arundo donax TaxID=35708 RepID=A0A0A8XWL2_ARUDO